MSELITKQQQYRDLAELKATPGWTLLYEQIAARQVMDQVRLVDSPELLDSEMRTYLAGRVKGMNDVANLLDLLLTGLKEEIELLKQKDEENPDGNDTDPDTSDPQLRDAELAARSHSIDPGSSPGS